MSNILKGAEGSKEVPGLGHEVLRGGLWVFALRISSRILSFISLIILARLLVPEDFGLLGITLISIEVLEAFSTMGLREALVQRKEGTEELMDTAWTVNAARGVLLFAILYFVAPYVGHFFDTPAVTPLLRVGGVSLVLRGFSNFRVLYFQKELEFSKEFAYNITGAVALVAVSIPLAVIYRSVWALVLGYVAGQLSMLIVSYILIPRFPRLEFNSAHFKEMFAFGKWVFGSTVLVFLLTQGDDIFVGKVLGATALGFYQIAYRISNLPATEISHVIARVTFPAYAKMQDDITRMREAYLRVLHLIPFVVFPIAGMIVVLGGDFTRLFLGEKWLPMVPAMRVLALFGMIRAVGATTGVVFLAVGKPEISTKIKSGQLILLAILIYPLTMRWGILGTSVAVTIYALVFNVVAVAKVLKIIKSRYAKPIKLTLLPLVGTLVMAAGLFAMKSYAPDNVTYVYFFLAVLVGVTIYLTMIYIFDKFFHYEIKPLIKEQLFSLIKRT